MNGYEDELWEGNYNKIMRPGGFSLTDKLVKAASLKKHHTVLDIGCGLGETAAYLTQAVGCKVIGIDISEALILRARKAHPSLMFQHGSAEQMNIANSSIDCVMGECSFSIMDTQKVLCECARVIKPGGWLLLSDVYATRGGDEKKSFYTQSVWCDMIRKAGFHITMWEDESQLWKGFAAQVLWDFGDLSLLFSGCDKIDVKQYKPGYFTMAAIKK